MTHQTTYHYQEMAALVGYLLGKGEQVDVQSLCNRMKIDNKPGRYANSMMEKLGSVLPIERNETLWKASTFNLDLDRENRLSPLQCAAVIGWTFARKKELSYKDIMATIGRSRDATRVMLNTISRTIPIYKVGSIPEVWKVLD